MSDCENFMTGGECLNISCECRKKIYPLNLPVDVSEETWKKIIYIRAEIIIAFIAKYQCHPDEIVQVEERSNDGLKTTWSLQLRRKNGD